MSRASWRSQVSEGLEEGNNGSEESDACLYFSVSTAGVEVTKTEELAVGDSST